MPKCVVQPERVVYLGKNRVKHVMPECHVQVYDSTRTASGEQAIGAELKDIAAEQRHFQERWNPAYDNPAYGQFRIDFGKRVMKDFTYQQAADYLKSNQAAWPDYDFTAEIAYWEARERGERTCEACLAILKPAPACDCGCQRPPKAVRGWSSMGEAIISSLRAPTEESASPPLAAEAIPLVGSEPSSGASAALSRSDPPTPTSPAAPAAEEPPPW